MSYSNPMHHDIDSGLKPKFRAAYVKLKTMGVPVYQHPDDAGNFSIDAEAEGAQRWADYYGNSRRADLVFGVHLDLERELQARRLFAEWVNPGRLAVYEG